MVNRCHKNFDSPLSENVGIQFIVVMVRCDCYGVGDDDDDNQC